MPSFLRARKDVIDPRPIRVRSGPSFYNYYWKLMALFDLNEKGEFVLPFSRRLVHTNRLLWPRSHQQPPPPGYELCGCNGCEKKSYADHILKDYDDDDDPENGNIHVEEVHVESDDEMDDEPMETSKEDDNDDDDDAESDISSPSTSEKGDIKDDDDDEDDNDDDDDDDCFQSVSDPPSPFACDPYESFDYEC